MISLTQMAASAALGAFIGYFTNALAIKSLFRPLRPRWYSLGWQGVIPRNRARLAENIARVVGEDLLHRDYLLQEVRGQALQESLHDLVGGWVERLLGTSPAALLARVPPPWREGGMERLGGHLLAGLARWAAGEEGRRAGQDLLAAVEEQVRGLALEQVLSAPGAERLVEHLGRTLGGEQTRARLEAALGERLEAALDADAPLETLVPAGLRELLHERLRQEVPALLERLAAWLTAPEHVEQVSQRLLAALESFAEQEGWLRRLIGELGLRLFREQIRAALLERVPRAARDYLQSAALRHQIEEQLLGGINAFLRRPLREVAGRHRQALAERAAFVLAALATSAETQAHLARLLLDEYRRRAAEPLGALLPESLWAELRQCCAGALALPETQARDWGERLGGWLAQRLGESHAPLRQVLGLEREDEERIVALVQERATEVLFREVPLLVDRLDLRAMVRAKIMAFDLLRVERLIRDIISDQLRYINLLGALLGGLVGLFLPLINAFLAGLGL